MNNLRNNVQLIGHLGTDPEVKNFENGKMKASFSLATNDVYKKEGAYETDTQWHHVVAWNNTAKIAEKILKKGCEVAISGKITYNNYEDKNGIRRYSTDIIANDLLLIKQAKEEE